MSGYFCSYTWNVLRPTLNVRAILKFLQSGEMYFYFLLLANIVVYPNNRHMYLERSRWNVCESSSVRNLRSKCGNVIEDLPKNVKKIIILYQVANIKRCYYRKWQHVNRINENIAESKRTFVWRYQSHVLNAVDVVNFFIYSEYSIAGPGLFLRSRRSRHALSGIDRITTGVTHRTIRVSHVRATFSIDIAATLSALRRRCRLRGGSRSVFGVDVCSRGGTQRVTATVAVVAVWVWRQRALMRQWESYWPLQHDSDKKWHFSWYNAA